MGEAVPDDGDRRAPLRVETSQKRVRAYLGGELICDTVQPRLVWEIPYYPAYYVPIDDVCMELLEPSGHASRAPWLGEARHFTVRVGCAVAAHAAWSYVDPPVEALRATMRFHWSAMDAWFEEDEEVVGHPRDPYTRVDALDSSRHVQVILDGLCVADTHRPKVLFETGMPPRFYIPPLDVRMDLLVPTGTVSLSPYKGRAEFFSLTIGSHTHVDVAWSYPAPLPECAKVAGLVAFANERVDLVIDGAVQTRVVAPADEPALLAAVPAR
jgi:uncharacterized protein (DUF427 family)